MMRKNELGHTTTVSMALTNPVMNFKEMEFKSLSLLLGKNGSGKSFVLKMQWAVHFFMKIYVEGRKAGLSLGQSELQWILDNTFVSNDIGGDIVFNFSNNNSVNFSIDKGTVYNTVINLDKEVTEAVQPVYMSTETRLMTDVAKFLKMKNMMSLGRGPLDEEGFKKMLGIYRIYDLMFLETLIHNLMNNTNSKTIENLNESLSQFDKDFIVEDIRVEESIPDIIITTKDFKDRSVSFLGNGHQALLTMHLALVFQNQN